MNERQLKPRTLGKTLAATVQELELRQPAVVTRALLTEIADQTGTRLTAGQIAERLVRAGWLLPLRQRDAWEFSPAARAGATPAGDPWIGLRAVLEHDPLAPLAIAFESAVWELGHSAHQPTKGVVAHRRGWSPPRSLAVRAVTFDWHVPAETVRGLPVLSEATVLVGAAHRPSSQRNWGNADDWLPETFRATTPVAVLAEASGRPLTTLARLGYLAEWSGRADIADEVEALLPSKLSVTFLGPRDRREHWRRRWHLYDGLLPQR